MAVWAALIGVVGALVGVASGTWNERYKANREQARAAAMDYRAQLRTACVAHASNLNRYRSAIRRFGADNDPDVEARIEQVRADTADSMETLRLLSNSEASQKAARLALRHLYALREEAAGRPDPRPAINTTPYSRYEIQFRQFLIEARTELGLAEPTAVYAAP